MARKKKNIEEPVSQLKESYFCVFPNPKGCILATVASRYVCCNYCPNIKCEYRCRHLEKGYATCELCSEEDISLRYNNNPLMSQKPLEKPEEKTKN